MELKRLLELAGVDTKTNKVLLESEGNKTPAFLSKNGGTVLFPDRVVKHIKSQHSGVGKGSFFSPNINIKEVANTIKAIDLDSNTALYTVKVPGAGFDLVKTMADAKQYPDAKEGTTMKEEGKNEVEVPTITTSLPIGKFKTNEMTLVIRQANPEYVEAADKKAYAEALNNKTLFSVLSAWPGQSQLDGKEIPPSSKWNGQFAVIIPRT